MDGKKPEYLDPETLSMLRETLDDAWDCLQPEQKATMLKTELAARILDAAAEGERDRDVLINAALIVLVA
jgi:hypothetical protein